METIVHFFMSSHLDISLYVRISQSSLSQLQLVQNAAGRLLTGTKKRDRVSPVLASLHWLHVKYRIVFKIFLFGFTAVQGLATNYITTTMNCSSLVLPSHPADLLTKHLHSMHQVITF